MYKLGERSLKRLEGVHPDLVLVVKRAIERTTIDFTVVEGVRSLEQQKQNVAKGVSQTMNSKHLLQKDGFAHAVDLAPLVDGKIPWDDWNAFKQVAEAMKMSAVELNVRLTWGGDWKTLKDGPHFQIEV